MADGDRGKLRASPELFNELLSCTIQLRAMTSVAIGKSGEEFSELAANIQSDYFSAMDSIIERMQQVLWKSREKANG